jgi:hypothetical protein
MATSKSTTHPSAAQGRATTTTPPRLTKFRLPRARILRFTPTGKATSISEQMIAEDQLIQAHFPSCPEFSNEPVRLIILAWLRKKRGSVA